MRTNHLASLNVEVVVVYDGGRDVVSTHEMENKHDLRQVLELVDVARTALAQQPVGAGPHRKHDVIELVCLDRSLDEVLLVHVVEPMVQRGGQKSAPTQGISYCRQAFSDSRRYIEGQYQVVSESRGALGHDEALKVGLLDYRSAFTGAEPTFSRFLIVMSRRQCSISDCGSPQALPPGGMQLTTRLLASRPTTIAMDSQPTTTSQSAISSTSGRRPPAPIGRSKYSRAPPFLPAAFDRGGG